MYKTVVIKMGSSVLLDETGELDKKSFQNIVDQASLLQKEGKSVLLITSGAVGRGKKILQTTTHTEDFSLLKRTSAAIGQVKIMAQFEQLFRLQNIHIGQILISRHNCISENQRKEFNQVLQEMCRERVIPIINENDVVSTFDSIFTDNDELAAQVCTIIQADALLILSSNGGFKDEDGNLIRAISPDETSVFKHVTVSKSKHGRGGMTTKLLMAFSLAKKGIDTFITSGKEDGCIIDTLRNIGKFTKVSK